MKSLEDFEEAFENQVDAREFLDRSFFDSLYPSMADLSAEEAVVAFMLAKGIPRPKRLVKYAERDQVWYAYKGEDLWPVLEIMDIRALDSLGVCYGDDNEMLYMCV